MSNLNILISAYPNANITIVERDPSLRLTGASVDIRSSAVDIIKWMSAEQEICNHTTKEEGIQFVNANGKAVATLRATGRSDIQSVTSEFEIFRGMLTKIFIDLIITRVKLIFGESVDHFEQRNDGVAVTFAKSKEVKMYDLLVAADSLGSKIRGMMLDSKPQEQLYNEGVHVAYFAIKINLLQGGRLAKWYNATGGCVVFLCPDPDPVGRTRGNLMNRLNKALRDGNKSCMKLMGEMFRDAGWVAPEVLQDMRESDDFYCPLFVQIRSPKLHDGCVVLLGDAGYTTPGFGTSLAIIGGLCPCWRARYEEIMLPFAKSSQGGDNAMQLLNPQTVWGIRIRDAILGFVTWARLDRLTMGVASALGFTEKKAPMPDYQWPAR
ncbi:uncharacterized protein BDZ99DRAFT_511310 [Mytilinidion resinicola]|uniref:FAD/NAD(P)-binding domain-containing protein n=1 Tax=Mytilinidion resinicola TaxID=574789 RepID=A0A6A6Y8X9_9PEZI|nr:uncharacterized protein BDZ99DRAFT_511310 [Mytilinidion resinicola]KAF2805281.1 hypothetical protein BDZ99DRAFT_511310 [Mytilinidion resinicola]